MTPERAEKPKGLEGVAQPDRRARQRLERVVIPHGDGVVPEGLEAGYPG